MRNLAKFRKRLLTPYTGEAKMRLAKFRKRLLTPYTGEAEVRNFMK